MTQDTEGRRSTGGTRPATKKRAAPHIEATLAEMKWFTGGDRVRVARPSEIDAVPFPGTGKTTARRS